MDNWKVPIDIPAGYCYKVSMFGESVTCPYYDGSVARHPMYQKFNVLLSWTVPGHVIRCEQCRKPE